MTKSEIEKEEREKKRKRQIKRDGREIKKEKVNVIFREKIIKNNKKQTFLNSFFY